MIVHAIFSMRTYLQGHHPVQAQERVPEAACPGVEGIAVHVGNGPVVSSRDIADSYVWEICCYI